MSRLYLETSEAREKRAEQNQRKEIRQLADRISTYGRKVHAAFGLSPLAKSLGPRGDQLKTLLMALRPRNRLPLRPDFSLGPVGRGSG